MEYITAQQAADKWGVSLRSVQAYLTSGQIKGVKRFGRSWMIPESAEKPEDRRKYNRRKPKKE
jgi:predicted site-specific integrase-resolvase